MYVYLRFIHSSHLVMVTTAPFIVHRRLAVSPCWVSTSILKSHLRKSSKKPLMCLTLACFPIPRSSVFSCPTMRIVNGKRYKTHRVSKLMRQTSISSKHLFEIRMIYLARSNNNISLSWMDPHLARRGTHPRCRQCFPDHHHQIWQTLTWLSFLELFDIELNHTLAGRKAWDLVVWWDY